MPYAPPRLRFGDERTGVDQGIDPRRMLGTVLPSAMPTPEPVLPGVKPAGSSPGGPLAPPVTPTPPPTDPGTPPTGSTDYSATAEGVWNRIRSELWDTYAGHAGQDWAPADFGQDPDLGKTWWDTYRTQLINSIIPSLGIYNTKDPTADASDYQRIMDVYNTRGGTSPWHYLQLLYSAASMSDPNDALKDRALYDRTGSAEGLNDTARRHALAGYYGTGYAPEIRYGDYNTNPAYWIR